MGNIIELGRNEVSVVSGGLSTTDIQDVCKLALQATFLYWLTNPSQNVKRHRIAIRICSTVALFLGYNACVFVSALLSS